MAVPIRHSICSKVGHDVSLLDKEMFDSAHPFSADFYQLRQFYDGLKYAAAVGARFFSFEDEIECSIYSPPSLALADIKSVTSTTDLSPLLDYIQRCAESDWPNYCQPALVAGSWTIKTKSWPLVAALSELLADNGFPELSFGTWEILSSGQRVCTVRIFGPRLTAALVFAVARVIGKHHRHCIEADSCLDELQELDDLPLAFRPLVPSAKHKSLMVKPREIVVPVIPSGTAGIKMLARVTEALLDLLADGYDSELVESWLGQHYSKEMVRRLMPEVGYEPPKVLKPVTASGLKKAEGDSFESCPPDATPACDMPPAEFPEDAVVQRPKEKTPASTAPVSSGAKIKIFEATGKERF